MKKKELLTVKELAAELRLSLKSIQRGVSQRGDPRAMARSHGTVQSRQSSMCVGTQWPKSHAPSQEYSVTAGRDRRRSRRRAPQHRPRSVTRGHYPQGSLQEVQGFHEFTVHPHH